MAAGSNDVKFYKSAQTSGSDVCLGGAITTTQIDYNQNPASPIFNQVFRDFTNTERNNGSRQYHCIFVQNKHATLTLTGGKLWFSAVTPNPDTFSRMGLDPAGKNQPATTISNAVTEPSGVDLETRHNDISEALIIPDLAPNDFIAFWVAIELRPNAAVYNKDYFEIRVDITTPA